MRTVKPGGITERQLEVLAERLDGQNVTSEEFNKLLEYPRLVARFARLVMRDRAFVSDKITEAEVELDGWPKFSDQCLSKKGVTVLAGHRQGLKLPKNVRLDQLRPVCILQPEDRDEYFYRVIRRLSDNEVVGPVALRRISKELKARHGRLVAWELLNKGVPDWDKSKYYLFPGDEDLRDTDKNQVMVCVYFTDNRWDWKGVLFTNRYFGSQAVVLTLEPPDPLY